MDANDFVQKTLVADLLNVADPNGLGGDGTTNGVFTSPFITIEDIIPINSTTILVGDDNNYPFIAGRTANVPDNNEVAPIQLDTPIQLDPSLTQSVSVPEPASLAVFGLGLVGLLARRHRRAHRWMGTRPVAIAASARE